MDALEAYAQVDGGADRMANLSGRRLVNLVAARRLADASLAAGVGYDYPDTKVDLGEQPIRCTRRRELRNCQRARCKRTLSEPRPRRGVIRG